MSDDVKRQVKQGLIDELERESRLLKLTGEHKASAALHQRARSLSIGPIGDLKPPGACNYGFCTNPGTKRWYWEGHSTLRCEEHANNVMMAPREMD